MMSVSAMTTSGGMMEAATARARVASQEEACLRLDNPSGSTLAALGKAIADFVFTAGACMIFVPAGKALILQAA